MTKFQPSNRHNPCPVCSKTNGDCRTIGQNLVLCHSHIDKHQDPNHPDYQYIKPSKCGIWGTFRVRTNENFNRERWEQEKELRKAQQEKAREKQSKAALSTEEMDKALRKLHRYIGLTEKDRQHLRDRGLTNEQIDAGLFFSVSPNQDIPPGIPLNLPGIDRSGRKLACSHAGIACIAFDKDGKAIGYQVRLRDAKNGKYRWAKGQVSSHLSNGELPLTITGPSLTHAKIVWLTEGILKPLVASQKWGIPCIGAAGGNHRGSQEQLRTALESLPDDCLIAIAPDAGAVLNKSVLKQYENTVQLLTDWGYQERLKFVWYGQIPKDGHDCDEIDQETFNRIRYIDPKTFFDIAQNQQRQQQYWDVWKKSKQFTPDITTNTRYFSYPMGESSNTIELGTGGLGSGKTTKLRKQLLENWTDKGVINIGYRNLLLIQFGEHEKLGKYKFSHINIDTENVYFADNQLWLSACIDSILKIPLEAFDGKLLILDEVVSIIKHLLFSSTVRQRPLVIKHFFEAVRRCDRVIALDGNMADWVGTFFEGINSGKQIIKIENQYETPKPLITLLTGTVGDDDILKPNDRSPLIRQLLNEQEKFVVCSDSQIFLESVDILLTKQGKKTFRLDSKTVGDKALKIAEILKGDINKWLKENNIDVLLYSPSAESGLDIEIKNYFKSHYVFLFGVIDIDSAIQKLGRIRDTECRKYVWCRSYSIIDEPADSKSYDAEILAYYQNQSLTRDLHSVMSGEVDGLEMIANILKMIQESHGPDSKTANQLQAIRNFERANFRECLTKALTMRGYIFDEVAFDKNDPDNFAAKEQLKTATNEVKDQNSRDIFAASDQFVGRINTVLRFDADWPTRCALEKARWLNRLPGIEQTKIWQPNLIRLVKYDKPNLVSSLERYYLAQNLDIARLLSVNKYKKLNERAIAGETVCGWQLKNEYSMAQALVDIGILKLLDHPNEQFTVAHPLIKSIISKAETKPVQHALKRKVSKDPMRFIGSLVRSIGMEWKRVCTKVNGQTQWHYQVINPIPDSPTLSTLLVAIERRFSSIADQYNSSEEAKKDTKDAQKIYSQNSENLSPETIAVTELEQVTHWTSFYVKKDAQCVTQESVVQFTLEQLQTDTDAAQWHSYYLGQKVWLWRVFEGVGNWSPAVVDKVNPSMIHVQGDHFGRMIEAHNLNLIAPMEAITAGTG